MDYIVRINPKAMNVLTRKIDFSRIWEVEQAANKDSEKVIWHCAAVTINTTPLETYLREHNIPIKELKLMFHGIVFRGADESITIKEGKHDGSGW